MITKTGAWIAETDYTNYPKDKMCCEKSRNTTIRLKPQ